jgi:hypothetical protein
LLSQLVSDSIEALKGLSSSSLSDSSFFSFYFLCFVLDRLLLMLEFSKFLVEGRFEILL